jgi:hypothetical protein
MGQETDKDLKKAKHELGDEQLDKVSGGAILDNEHLPESRRGEGGHGGPTGMEPDPSRRLK